MAIMTVTLKNSLKLLDGQIIPGGKVFRGELNELPEWLQQELKMNSRVLEVERLRIPDVKKAPISELKKDSLMTETQKAAPVEIKKEPVIETVPELEKKLGKKVLKPLKDIASSKKPTSESNESKTEKEYYKKEKLAAKKEKLAGKKPPSKLKRTKKDKK